MFYLIGIGNKIGDINQETIDIIKNCDEVYLEYYTSFYDNTIEELESFFNKKINIADREVVESKVDMLLKEKKKIALLIIGDSLSATTHIDILERCNEKGIKSQIVNNISIFSLIGRTGLQIYKFGKTTSIPFYSSKFMPKTPLNVLKENLSIGAHTLFLLDIDPINDNYLKINEALNFLLKVDDEKLISNNTKVIACSKLNTKSEKIIYDTVENVIRKDEQNKLLPPVCLVIPGKMHFMEEDYLKKSR